MNRFFICVCMAALLCGCSDADQKTTAVNANSGQPAPQLNDGHTASNAIDYHGVYKTDDAACEFSRIEIGQDGNYRLLAPSGDAKTGSYQWEADGRVMILLGSAIPDLRLFVGENYLRLNGTTPKDGTLFTKVMPDAGKTAPSSPAAPATPQGAK